MTVPTIGLAKMSPNFAERCRGKDSADSVGHLKYTSQIPTQSQTGDEETDF